MDATTIALTIFTLLGWGTGGFIAKLAANRIGTNSVFFDLIGYAAGTVIFTLFILRPGSLVSSDRVGIAYAVIAGFIGSVGGIGFYMLMVRKDASVVAPLTALYPALTAVLAFVFLREQLTLMKGIGIIMATVSMVLLSL